MNLSIDIGNTFFKAGIFSDSELVSRYSSDNFEELWKSLLAEYIPSKCIVSTTRKDIQDVVQRLEETCKTLVLNHETPVPISMDYQTPETLGLDRLAAMVYAYNNSRDQHAIVIDAGTCITFDWLDNKGVYRGGNISPGIQMRLRAMHDYTAALPLLDIENHANAIGWTTSSAMQNGAVKGTIWEVDSFIAHVKAESMASTINVFFTGGNGDFLGKYVKSQIFVDENLVLYGLNQILRYNA